MVSLCTPSVKMNCIPDEIILFMCEHLYPLDMCNFMFTSKHYYNLILDRISYFADLYSKMLHFDVEKFMWSQFNNEYLLIKDKEQLFLRMLFIHKFPQTTIMEEVWEEYDLENDDNYGPLIIARNSSNEESEENDDINNELYITKLKCGIIAGLTTVSIDISAMYSYSCNFPSFLFLFKFITKYNDAASLCVELLEFEIVKHVSEGITFEMLDSEFQKVLAYGISEYDTYMMFIEHEIEYFLHLISYGFDNNMARLNSDQDFSDYKLEIFNAIRHIIGNTLAYHLLFELYINIDDYPELLQTIVEHRLSGMSDDIIMQLQLV